MDTKVAGAKSSKVLRILDHLYDKTETLGVFAQRIIPDKLKLDEIENSYASFLCTTLVCSPPNVRPTPVSWNVEQQSQQHEIILRVVERIRRREGSNSTNLMTMGYYTKSDKSAAQVSASSCNVEYGFSNNNTSRLLYTHWKTLLSHIGDDAMLYLLENLVVFMSASSSCYIQLTGTPLYELWPFRRYCAKSYQRSIATKRLCNSLLNDSKNRRARRKCRANFSRSVSDKESSVNAQSGLLARNQHTDKETLAAPLATLSSKKGLATAKRRRDEFDGTDSKKKRQCVRNGAIGCEMDATDACIRRNESIVVVNEGQDEQDVSIHFKPSHQDSDNVMLPAPSVDQSSPSPASSCYLSACESFGGSVSTLSSLSSVSNHSRSLKCSSLNDPVLHGAAHLETVHQGAFTFSSELRCNDPTNPVSSSSEQTNETRTVHRRVRKSKLSGDKEAIPSMKSIPFEVSLCLNRAGLFYCKNLSEAFLPRYLLSGLVTSDANKLAERVLGTVVDNSWCPSANATGITNQNTPRNLGLEMNYHLIKPELVDMLLCLTRNHVSCPYKRLLDFHCKKDDCCVLNQLSAGSGNFPDMNASSSGGLRRSQSEYSGKLPAGVVKTKTRVMAAGLEKKLDAKELSDSEAVNVLLDQHCSHREVYLFARACCLRVIPTELFGSQSNRKVFFRNVRKFIGMGRFEQFSLGGLMSNMKVTHCRWMSKLRSNASRLRLLAKVVYWLSSYILVLLRSFFYVTDTAVYKNRIFYYPKSVWKQIHRKGLAATLTKRVYLNLTSEEAEQSVTKKESLGFASLRFLPKPKGLRSIVNMSQKRKLYEPTINSQLRDLQQIFMSKLAPRGIMATSSSVFSLDDIYTRWKQFLESRKRRNDSRPLYFIKVDIENCYDSIDQGRLFEIARRLLLQDSSNDYIVRRYATVVAAGGRMKRSFHRVAASLADFQPSFLQFVKTKISERQSSDMIFIDQVLNERVKSETLLKTLRSHLFNNIVKIDRQYFKQVCGITQGSVLSTLLCDIYYNDMEKNKITVNEEDELLMRQVDDFLFVTPVYSSAITFLNLMSYGVADYGCRINVRKTVVNFPVECTCPGEEPIAQLPENALFPWCGLLINTGSLSIHTDFTRYAGLHISDTMTVNVTRNPGRVMLHKLVFSLRSRCHRIYLDTDINSDAEVAANVYRIFLLAAYKFHSYARRLPVRGNQAFLVDTLYEISSFVSSNVKKAVSEGHCERQALDWNVVQLLCLEAFKTKLGRHRGGYRDVLKMISKRLAKLERLLSATQRQQVAAAIENKLPAEFELILS